MTIEDKETIKISSVAADLATFDATYPEAERKLDFPTNGSGKKHFNGVIYGNGTRQQDFGEVKGWVFRDGNYVPEYTVTQPPRNPLNGKFIKKGGV